MPADARPARYSVSFEVGELLIAGYDDKGDKVVSVTRQLWRFLITFAKMKQQ